MSRPLRPDTRDAAMSRTYMRPPVLRNVLASRSGDIHDSLNISKSLPSAASSLSPKSARRRLTLDERPRCTVVAYTRSYSSYSSRWKAILPREGSEGLIRGRSWMRGGEPVLQTRPASVKSAAVCTCSIVELEPTGGVLASLRLRWSIVHSSGKMSSSGGPERKPGVCRLSQRQPERGKLAAL